ncbi:hypothetical protein A5880_001494 [Enterococcus sp. 4G2_DIV0659]|uniref:Uncharacterized protein n=2 Tax=Candidatus Enterococcus mansonii TaxID=1834181 RepID=A0A242CDV0_9ENTE|nr:hypothetical protein A5880_001415 [Enterococcus sp. 4G2_DIV0659]
MGILVGLGIFLFVFTLFIPFIVQERLMLFLTIGVLSALFFNGKVSSDRRVIYKLNIKDPE